MPHNRYPDAPWNTTTAVPAGSALPAHALQKMQEIQQRPDGSMQVDPLIDTDHEKEQIAADTLQHQFATEAATDAAAAANATNATTATTTVAQDATAAVTQDAVLLIEDVRQAKGRKATDKGGSPGQFPFNATVAAATDKGPSMDTASIREIPDIAPNTLPSAIPIKPLHSSPVIGF